VDIIKQMQERRVELVKEMTRIAETAVGFGRDMSEGESRRYDDALAEVNTLEARIADLQGSEQRAKDTEDAFAKLAGQPAARGGSGPERHPLAYTPESLNGLQAAIDSRSAGRFEAADTETRAALATTTYGAPRVWGSNVLNGPRLLHVLAGVPQQPSDAVLAQHPVLTLPAAQGSVGENVSLGEFASSTAGSVTLARFGRWTDMSRESLVGTDAGAITALHRIGVAKDLDKVLIDLVEANTGAAAAFTADVPAAVRKAIAQVLDDTAAEDPADLVVLVHPDNAALLQDVTPIGGQTIAERFQRFSGSLVYASSAVDTGFVSVANLRAGARYFEARALATETEVAVKTGTLTVASSVISGYGLTLAGGAYRKVDVVTP
jgi:hypothetical protein